MLYARFGPVLIYFSQLILHKNGILWRVGGHDRVFVSMVAAPLHTSWCVSQLIRKATSKSDIIYAGEENTPQILSDLNEKFTRS